ncbi:MAG: hypothetical protein LBS05_11200, partial [Tannerellaceae bacterium]|nr:hypothetical protein [Tannerellaceae bacterium]
NELPHFVAMPFSASNELPHFVAMPFSASNELPHFVAMPFYICMEVAIKIWSFIYGRMKFTHIIYGLTALKLLPGRQAGRIIMSI